MNSAIIYKYTGNRRSLNADASEKVILTPVLNVKIPVISLRHTRILESKYLVFYDASEIKIFNS